jgi:aspartyl-tRNA(Asn)/glutamyl-tRNA(Gln) amidotransferase subunit B
LVELLGLTKKDNKTISMLDTKFFNNFIDFLLLLKENKINGKQGKQILEQMYSTNANPAEIIEKFAIKQIDNIDEINNVIEEIISKNQAILLEYKTNPIKVEKFLMGMIMKETKGQANPIITNDCLKKILARFN